jgi:uncharacterized protein YdeI (YjbR/CyaY-like superfamily)
VNKKPPQLPVVAFPDGVSFAAWLDQQDRDCPGLWLKFAKKASGIPSITQREALDVALCYGWIDGQRQGLDDQYYLNKYTPRRSRSNWSEINRARALELIKEGRMRPGGHAEIDRAKADGRWDAASPPPGKAGVPDDLLAALKQNAAARKLFGQLDSRNRYAILYRIQGAKKPGTRAARIAKFVEMLAKGETPYPQKKA